MGVRARRGALLTEGDYVISCRANSISLISTFLDLQVESQKETSLKKNPTHLNDESCRGHAFFGSATLISCMKRQAGAALHRRWIYSCVESSLRSAVNFAVHL